MDQISVDETFGPLLISLYLAIYLTSSCVHLNLSYFRTTNDTWKWKSSVSFMTVASSAHTGILCWAVYEHLIRQWGETEGLTKGSWAFSAHIGFLVAIGFIVQLYYAFKLSTLYSARLRIGLVSSIALFASAQLAFGIVACYNSVHYPFPLFAMSVHQDLGWQTLSYLVCTVICNSIISIASLVDARSPRFAVRSEKILEVASRLIIETNLLATICSILSLSFLLAWNNEGRQSGVWMAFALILPKLYVYALLASHTRGAEITRARLTTDYGKHASSLSDLFKGSPISPISRSQNPITISRIGTPQAQVSTSAPIADRYANQGQGAKTPDSPGWLRRTIQPSPHPPQTTLQTLAPPLPSFTRQSSATALSISDYGEFLSSDHNEPPGGVEEDLYHSSPEISEEEKGFSTSIEVTLSPRRTSFVDSKTEMEMDHIGLGLNGLGGRQPVSYGYL
ncbi:hypothetical protein JCM5353_002245 [Sporobolomyces roseus]